MAQAHGENLKQAMDTLRAHKMRSALTVFGVVLGVSVIMLVAGLLSGFDNGRERDYARCRAALRLRPEDSGANQAVWGGHRLHCQMGSGPARRAATARRTSTQAAHPRRRQSHPRRLPGGQECDRLSANALGPGP